MLVQDLIREQLFESGIEKAQEDNIKKQKCEEDLKTKENWQRPPRLIYDKFDAKKMQMKDNPKRVENKPIEENGKQQPWLEEMGFKDT
ncbi:MAG: hypothetical protein LQ351_003607 [Letrouitia transgressa]|nr:MAG: hypothetical protein LQ351_003607 [Letrouitia transgressa]